ncbi:hypothetical protein AC578_4599 [Pseudocercospora eumusae]|uniref:C2H2-type domain-containing protein n=1 Tax=Pseudocercospora eumusae TaxID=321146 RepID=A0A139H4Z7_9PEZI|nr:hypothetical protein AC578_4599 [Pseudocercospora eumusae]KXS97514.1 hypothetical protein AC578_4599 [Pseudocercospora eumusae]
MTPLRNEDTMASWYSCVETSCFERPLFDPQLSEHCLSTTDGWYLPESTKDVFEHDALEKSEGPHDVVSLENAPYTLCPELHPLDCSDEDWMVSKLSSPATTISGITDRGQPKTERLSCSVCNTWYPTRSKLELHAKETGHACFVCRYAGCGKRYNRRDVYSRHKKNHQAVIGIACSRCDVKPFKRKDHLQQHTKTCHSGIVGRSNYMSADMRSESVKAETERTAQCDKVKIRDLVSRIGAYLGDDTEDALRLLLEQVKLQRQPRV